LGIESIQDQGHIDNRQGPNPAATASLQEGGGARGSNPHNQEKIRSGTLHLS
jgi:hypothetical protein